MSNSIPFIDLKAQYAHLKPRIDERIQKVLEHGQYIMGPEVAELEGKLSDWAGGAEAIGVSSGTDALLMALMACEIGPGDAVFLPSFTFTATAEVALLQGATPVFVDVEPDSFNLDVRHLADQIAAVARAGELRPRAIIPVDLFGLPADYVAISEVAEQHGLVVIDDAAQGLGGRLGGAPIGSLAPLTATSFFPAKPLGGYGDGGAVFALDAEVAHRLRSIRAHGKGDHKYEIVRVGINGRLDTLQAAILLVKLEVFGEELKARDQLAQRYNAALGGLVQVPRVPEDCQSAWAQYSIVVPERQRVLDALKEAGVPSAIYYPLPMHLQPAYAAYGAGQGSLPVSEALSRSILSLPMHPYMSEENADRAIAAVQAGTASD